MLIQQSPAAEHLLPEPRQKKIVGKADQFNLFGHVFHMISPDRRKPDQNASGPKGTRMHKDATNRRKPAFADLPQAAFSAASVVAPITKSSTDKTTASQITIQKNEPAVLHAKMAGPFARKANPDHMPHGGIALPAKAVGKPHKVISAKAPEWPPADQTTKGIKAKGAPPVSERARAPNMIIPGPASGGHTENRQDFTPAPVQFHAQTSPTNKPAGHATARHAEQVQLHARTPLQENPEPPTADIAKPAPRRMDAKAKKPAHRIKPASVPTISTDAPVNTGGNSTRHISRKDDRHADAKRLDQSTKTGAMRIPEHQRHRPAHWAARDHFSNSIDSVEKSAAGQKGSDKDQPETAHRESFHSPSKGAPHRSSGNVQSFSGASAEQIKNQKAEDVPQNTGDESSGIAPIRSSALAQVSVPEKHASALPPPLARHVTEQVVHAAIALHDGPVEISLSPKELGHVRMTLHTQENGAMSVAIHTERPQALDLMRRNIDQLASDLRDLGYEGLTFSFSESGQHENENPAMMAPDDPEHSQTETNPATMTADAALPLTRITIDTTDGIDIRL